MKLKLKRIRLRALWLLVPVYFLLARPTLELLLAAAALAVIGVAIRGWAAGTIQKREVLTTTGPYAHTRNPLYLGTVFIGLGMTVASGRIVFLLVFLAFFGLVYWPTMRREERYLEEQFGEAFREYARSVPLFFPSPRAYRAGASFSFERYRRNREHEALLGVVAAFIVLAAKLAFFP